MHHCDALTLLAASACSTPGFKAPECQRPPPGAPDHLALTAAADVFGLAGVAFTALMGKSPFPGTGNDVEACVQVGP